MKNKRYYYLFLAVVALAGAFLLAQGCNNQTPSLGAMAYTNPNTPMDPAFPKCTSTSTPALVDDMEDNNNEVLFNECRGGYWYYYHDPSPLGIQTTGGYEYPLILTPGYTPTPQSGLSMAVTGVGYGCTGASGHALEISTNNRFTSWGAGFGLNFINPPPAPNTYAILFDASSYTGIRFCAKNSTGNLVVTFMLTDDVAARTTNVTLTSAWQQYAFSFGSVFPSLNRNKLFNAQWQVNQSTASDIWIDNLEFYH
jgi:hypothetical protein